MKIYDQVLNILKASHKARNDDKALHIIYMQKAGMNLSQAQIDIFKAMPSLETVRRTRQHIQEKGLYRADEAIEEARYNKYVDVRQNIKGGNPEEVLENYKVLPWGQ